MGRHTFQAGTTPEAATAIKLANNQMLGCAMVAMAEAFALVRKFDVVPQVLYEVMTEGLFSAPAYKIYGKKMVDESYDQVGFANLGRTQGCQLDPGGRRPRARADAKPQCLSRSIAGRRCAR